MIKILYIHGLDSKLSDEKREILEKFGKIYAPDLNYYTNPNAISSITEDYSEVKIDVIIGSSIGGFAGFYVSNYFGKPALLFNPALKSRSVKQNIPENSVKGKGFKQIVLGQKDDVVDPVDTLAFLANGFDSTTLYHCHILPTLTHNIPLDVFEEEVFAFVRKTS